MRRGVILGGVGLAAVAAAVVVAAGAGVLSLGPDPVGAADLDATSPPDTATIERRTLEVSAEFDGTLGYDSAFEVIGNLRGTVTMLPEAGAVLGMGDRLVEVDGGAGATILLFGRRPAWRDLRDGISGLDVRQLEENLVILGLFEGLTPDKTWDDDTTDAVEGLQKQTGLDVDGSLELGEVVFLSEAIRVTKAIAAVGTQLGPGQPILEASWTDRVISIDLGVSDQDRLPEGAAVQIELPDGTIVPGSVTEVGRVATSQGDGFGSEATIDVTVVPDDPAAVEGLDAAPVTIRVVGSAREDVLTVPVSALLALLEGGYAVEVLDDDGSTRYVAIDAGLFQDGLVEIRGDGLEEGMQVVIP